LRRQVTQRDAAGLVLGLPGSPGESVTKLRQHPGPFVTLDESKKWAETPLGNFYREREKVGGFQLILDLKPSIKSVFTHKR
jgi:hypothetical protein